MKQESKKSLFTNIFFVMFITVIIMVPILLYGYSKIKSAHDKEVAELKNQICRGYGFDGYGADVEFLNAKYEACYYTVPTCGSKSYQTLDSLISNKGILNETFGCGGGGPGKSPEEI